MYISAYLNIYENSIISVSAPEYISNGFSSFIDVISYFSGLFVSLCVVVVVLTFVMILLMNIGLDLYI